MKSPDYSSLPEDGGLDWGFLADRTPDENFNDFPVLEKVLQNFISSSFSQTEARLIPNQFAQKLFQFLKIGVKYLLDSQSQLQEELSASEKKAKRLSQKLEKLSQENSEKDILILKASQNQSEKCIVCGKKFQSLNFLDSHIQRRHSSLLNAWISLRTGEVHGVNELLEEINELKRQLQEIKVEPSENIQSPLLEDLRNQQEELLEKAKLELKEQFEFKRELDKQIAELKEIHSHWMQQVINQGQPAPPELLKPTSFVKASATMSRIAVQRGVSPPKHEVIHKLLDEILEGPSEMTPLTMEEAEDVLFNSEKQTPIDIDPQLLEKASFYLRPPSVNDPKKNEILVFNRREIEIELNTRKQKMKFLAPEYVRNQFHEKFPELEEKLTFKRMEISSKYPTHENEEFFDEIRAARPQLPPISNLPETLVVSRVNRNENDFSSDQVRNAVSKLPKKQIASLDRPFGLPGDVEIETISYYSGDYGSSSIPFMENHYRTQVKKEDKRREMDAIHHKIQVESEVVDELTEWESLPDSQVDILNPIHIQAKPLEHVPPEKEKPKINKIIPVSEDDDDILFSESRFELQNLDHF